MGRNIRIVRQLGTGLKQYRMMFKEFKKKKKKKKERSSYSHEDSVEENITNFKTFFFGEGGRFKYSRISFFAMSSNLNSAKRRE